MPGPEALLRPQSLAQACEQLRDAAGENLALLVTGAGTAAGWGGEPAAAQARFDTTALDRLLRHQATDLTVAVEAGIPLRTLQAALAEQGQRVAFDAARVDAGATVGGLIATGDAGPSVLAHGTLRDLVIGATLLLADGTLARSGGQVIKNVAGYDLAKLVHGSLGTLAVIAEVWLRLHPLPPATATLRVQCDTAAGYTLATQLLERSLEPTALEWYAGVLLARFEGTARGLAQRARQALALAGAAATWSEADDEPGWAQVAAATLGSDGDTVLRAGTLPSLAPWLAGQVDTLAAAHGVEATMHSSLASGIHDVLVRAGSAPARAAFVAELRREVHGRGGLSTIRRWGEGLAGEVPAWPDPPPALPVMRAVKQAFDPAGRLGTGRFAPWF